MGLKFSQALARQGQGIGSNPAIRMELHIAEPAERRHHLILRADRFSDKLLFDMDAFLSKLHFRAQAPTQGVQGVEQADGESRARSHTAARWQVAIVVQLQAALEPKMLENGFDDRVSDFRDGFARLDLAINQANAVFKKWRQVTASQVAVFINACRQYRPAMPPIPSGIVRAAAEKRNAKRSATDDHP
jgi:hypothetical protein